MQRNHGIDVNGEKICALLYADDLLIIGQSAEQLQDLLDSMYGWCRKWKLLINVSKSNIIVIHFRKTGTKETNFFFFFFNFVYLPWGTSAETGFH